MKEVDFKIQTLSIPEEPAHTVDKPRLDAFFGYADRDESDYVYIKNVVLPQCLKIEEDFWQQDRFRNKQRFHYKNNIWIITNSDGSVDIVKVDQTHQYGHGFRRGLMDKWEVIYEFNFDFNSWKSIVKSTGIIVSPSPERGESVEVMLCPKCEGDGIINSFGTTTSCQRVCPVCNGTRLVPKYMSLPKPPKQ